MLDIIYIMNEAWFHFTCEPQSAPTQPAIDIRVPKIMVTQIDRDCVRTMRQPQLAARPTQHLSRLARKETAGTQGRERNNALHAHAMMLRKSYSKNRNREPELREPPSH